MERTVLQAAEGMVYTNGTDGGKTIYLAVGESPEGWYQIPEQEHILNIEGGMAAEDDYLAALREFGVQL